ncbi:MAG TPA: ABC transporter substrate-binding protein [Dehalococcoidia bacterium]|nr:ABC transporter substrate-binding protein [Dehalococcoidia bacterium]
MNRSDYWSGLLTKRANRRRFVAGASAVALGAAALSLSCGGGDDKKEGSSASNLLYKPVDTTSKAVRGGTLTRVGSNRGFDVTRSAAENSNASPTYSRLVKYDVAKYPERPQPTVVADAATGWEISPDGLTATYKLRPNMKFDPRPPTNGKVMTSADVKYSWETFEGKAVARANLANSASPDAPILGVTAPDANTVVFKLAFKYAPLGPMLAFNRHIFILPTEAGQYNLKTEMRGTGAWRLKEFSQDSRAVFEKNPDWYDATKINLDGLVYYVIPEWSTQLAQFRTGALATIDFLQNQDDVLQTKREQPKLLMSGETAFDRTPFWLRFGYLQDSPFRDERVRKAVSLSTDRNLYIDTFGNVDRFRKEGLEAPTAWNSCFGAGEPSWLNPEDTKTFGENARWYKFDPAEAKKLMTAAGYKDPVETKFTLSGNPGEGTLSRPAEVLAGMWNANRLFNFKMNYVELNSVFRPQYHYNYDKHEGIAIGGGGADYPDPDGNLQVNFKSGQDRTGHLDADGKPDAYLDGLIEKQRAESDWNKRLAIFHDFQRHFASKMYFLHQPGDALGFQLAQPWFGNWRVYNGQSDAGGGSEMQEGGVYYWIDSSKKV